VLRPLVEEYLDDDPAMRPSISIVCGRIQVKKDVCMREYLQDYITMCQQNEHLSVNNLQQSVEIEQLRNETKQLKDTIQQMV